MKKNIYTLCIIVVAVVVLLIPIGVYGANSVLGVRVSDDGTAQREEMTAIKELALVSGEKVAVTYDRSRSTKEGFADVYKDEKGNDYIVKNGKVTGFYSNEIDQPAADKTPIGEATAKKLASAVLADFTENADEYEFKSFTQKENYGQYYITLSRKIGDVFTEERAELSLMYDGGVKSVALYNEGEYADVPEELVAGITEEKLLSYAGSEMDIIYPEQDGEFEMSSFTLVKDSDGYYIAIYGNFADNRESVRYYLED